MPPACGSNGRPNLSMPDGAISLRHYANLFGGGAWLGSIRQSGVFAVASAAIATALGTLCAIGLRRLSSRTSELVRGILPLPLVIPPIVSAMALCRMWDGIRGNPDSTVAAAAVVTTVATVAVIALSLALGRRVRAHGSKSGPGGYGWTSS